MYITKLTFLYLSFNRPCCNEIGFLSHESYRLFMKAMDRNSRIISPTNNLASWLYSWQIRPQSTQLVWIWFSWLSAQPTLLTHWMPSYLTEIRALKNYHIHVFYVRCNYSSMPNFNGGSIVVGVRTWMKIPSHCFTWMWLLIHTTM